MLSIGIRATPKEVNYVVIDKDVGIIMLDKIIIPIALSVPERLKYIRLSILDVICESNVKYAGIKITESNSQTLSIQRIEIEGVIQEAFADSDLEKFYTGRISNISSKININSKQFKQLIESTDFHIIPIPNWKDLKKEQKEACLCALGAYNA